MKKNIRFIVIVGCFVVSAFMLLMFLKTVSSDVRERRLYDAPLYGYLRGSMFTEMEEKLALNGDPNEILSSGEPIICEAVRWKRYAPGLRILLSHGANTDVVTKSGYSLIGEALRNRNDLAVEILINNGVMPSENERGEISRNLPSDRSRE